MAKKKKSKAGRKPVADPKVEMRIYPVKSAVDALGTDEAKEIAVNAIYKEAKKKK
jgi:hypothetical protein